MDTKIFDERVGVRLRNLRRARKFSQRQVAVHLGLKRPAVTLMEQGRRKCFLSEVVSLTGLFGISLAELLRPVLEVRDSDRSGSRDCLRQCLAWILRQQGCDIDVDDVPNVVGDLDPASPTYDIEERESYHRLNSWLAQTAKLQLARAPIHVEPTSTASDFLASFKPLVGAECGWVLVGRALSGTAHAVVCDRKGIAYAPYGIDVEAPLRFENEAGEERCYYCAYFLSVAWNRK